MKKIMKSIQEIKEEFNRIRPEKKEDLEKDCFGAFIRKYETDERKAVRTLLERCRKKEEDLQREILRTEAMKQFERKYAHLGYICGIDEVGRGPFAGPVVACAVILPPDPGLLYLNDSKKLSEKKREELFEVILREAVSIGIGMRDAGRIDEINILQATYEAMREAIGNLSVEPAVLLNDAVTIPGVAIRQVPLIKGDQKSVSIAAASIVAKVTRDRMMREYDALMPEYGFAANKGYGTQEHIEAIRKYGPSKLHRRSFIHSYTDLQDH